MVIASRWLASVRGRLDFRKSVGMTGYARWPCAKAPPCWSIGPKGSVGRDVLATTFWPESPEEVVRTRLRRLLHRLRLALGEDVLTTDRSMVRWSPAIDLQVDSQLFEQACDRRVRPGLPPLSRRLF